MTDIQQWRRIMIQPPRVRTPAIVDLNDSEAEASPLTQRKPLRPTFTTRKSQSNVSGYDVKVPDHNWMLRRTPSWITDQPTPQPTVEEVIDSLMCNLLGDPFNNLTARFSSDLMRVFEGYRSLCADKLDLLAKLEHEEEENRRLQFAWDIEKRDYKAEVKRLELILSQGKRGLAEVTLARQDSLLKRGQRSRTTDESGLEAILEHLEKSKRYEDKTWGAQRAIMRQRSPSTKMKRLSRTLTKKASKRRGFAELPVGTLPTGNVSFLPTTGDNLPFEAHAQTSEPRTSASDDETTSTFSSLGDLLPEETADLTYSMTSAAPIPAPMAAQATQPTILTRKTPTMRMKASGFLSRFRSQLTLDTGGEHRFSFEAGDDAEPVISAPPPDTLPPGVKSRLLRKSASMSMLEKGVPPAGTNDRIFSTAAHSPATSTAADAIISPPDCEDQRRRTKIPTPLYQRNSLAQPRRERDDSSSSLLTAFRPSEDASHGSASRSSSAFISPSGSRIDLTQGLHGLDIIQTSTPQTSGSQRLIDHTNALRGSAALNTFAAKAANTAMQSVDHTISSSLEHRASERSANSSRNLHARWDSCIYRTTSGRECSSNGSVG